MKSQDVVNAIPIGEGGRTDRPQSAVWHFISLPTLSSLSINMVLGDWSRDFCTVYMNVANSNLPVIILSNLKTLQKQLITGMRWTMILYRQLLSWDRFQTG
jgi:hypothetical protein